MFVQATQFLTALIAPLRVICNAEINRYSEPEVETSLWPPCSLTFLTDGCKLAACYDTYIISYVVIHISISFLIRTKLK